MSDQMNTCFCGVGSCGMPSDGPKLLIEYRLPTKDTLTFREKAERDARVDAILPKKWRDRSSRTVRNK